MEIHEVHVFLADEVMRASNWLLAANDSLLKKTNEDGIALSQFVKDASTAVKKIKILGAIGKGYIKIVNGKKYIIFEGRAGARELLKGTRYLLTNPKVSMFVVGAEDILQDFAKATKITIFAYVAMDVIKEIHSDQYSLWHLIGKVGIDVSKALAAGAVGALAGVGVSAAIAGVVVVGASVPVVVAFVTVAVVSLAASAGIEWLDDHFKLTEKVIARWMGYKANVTAGARWIEDRTQTTVQYAENEMAQTLKTIQVDAAQFKSTMASVYQESKEQVARSVESANVYMHDMYWRSIEEVLSATGY